MENNLISETICAEHGREKSMFCEQESIWFCDFCMKNHRKCGFPLHYTEIIERFNQSGGQSFNYENYVKRMDQLIKFKDEVNEHLDNYMTFLKDTYNNNINVNNNDKIQVAMQIRKYTELNIENKSSESFERFYSQLSKLHTNLGNYSKLSLTNVSMLNSNIMNNEYLDMLKNWMDNPNLGLELVFKASRDGFKVADFYSKCSLIPNNLTVIKTSTGKIIGGYTPLAWRIGNNEYEYQQDAKKETFLFSFTLKVRCLLKENDSYAICYSKTWGPKFGGGHDLEVIEDCNTQPARYSGLGFSYQFDLKKEDFYGVSDKYLIEDYEFYKVI